MPGPIARFFSLDDLWSVIGWGLILGVTRVTSPNLSVAWASVLACGMLAIFWLASEAVRARNAERHPNVRIAFWAVAAVVSALIAFA